MSEELSQLDHELLGDVDTSKKNDKTSQSKTSPNIDAPAEPNGIVLNMESVEGTVEASPEDAATGVAVEKLSLSPKKRGADSSEAETASPKKKRAPAKKKAEITGGVEKAPKNKRAPKGKAAGASVEAEANENEDLAKAPKSKGKKQTVNVKEPKTPKPKRGIKPEAEDDGEHEANGNKKTTHVIKQESPLTSPEATVPVTPKRKAKPGSGEEDAAKANEQNANSKAITHTPKKPRVGGNKIPGGTDVPASFELASTADKKMFSMKDAGSSWAEIRAMWKKETGQDTANSTLPNRYSRLKINMMHFKEGDDEKFRQAKKEVEADYERTKWTKIAVAMEANGANKYPQAFLERKWKEMVAADATAAVANGANHAVASNADGETQPNGALNAEADGEDSTMSD